MNSEMVYVPMKNWDESDQPREKLIEKGANELSNAELIAILLGSGSREESALDLSKKILKRFDNNISKLSSSDLGSLKIFRGMGPAKAVTLLAAFELGKRVKGYADEVKRITCSRDAFHLIRADIAHLSHEEFWIILLNNANKVIGRRRVSKGGVTGTIVDVKIIAREAVSELATGVIIFHNHPSGNLKPSRDDLQITKKVKTSLQLLDITLLDHLIVTTNDFYSFADEGTL